MMEARVKFMVIAQHLREVLCQIYLLFESLTYMSALFQQQILNTGKKNQVLSERLCL